MFYKFLRKILSNKEAVVRTMCYTLSRDYKKIMLNSAELEIILKCLKEYQAFQGSDKAIMLFILLLNVKIPIAVGILTFMNRKYSC